MSSNILTEHYIRWFDYEKDVHRSTLASLEAVPQGLRQAESFTRAVNLFAHIIAARSMWLYRFGVSDKPVELFPQETPLEDIPALLAGMEDTWSNYLSGLTDADLSRAFEYRSYEGDRFRSTVEDILTQLFGHSWYHRGQIAQLVRAIGAEPAVTDFVYWSREAAA